MKTTLIAGLAAWLISPASAPALIPTVYETNLQLAAYANLRHDVWGNSYLTQTDLADLYANLNSVNDDRAAIEFPTWQLPPNIQVRSATLTICVFVGGGNLGTTGTFKLFGYSGDGVATMGDYYQTIDLLRTFTETEPPAFGAQNFDVTAFLQGEAASGSTYSGFLFQAVSQNELMGFGCPGVNGYYPWPRLDVQYTVVPEPGIFGLAAAGAAVAVLHRRNARRMRKQSPRD